MEIALKKESLVQQICLLCTNTNIDIEGINKFNRLFEKLISLLTEDDLDDVLSAVIDNKNPQLKLCILNYFPDLSKDIPWLPQFLLLLIRDPDELVSINSINLLRQLDIQGFEEEALIEVEKIIGGRKKVINNLIFNNKRELVALELYEKLRKFKTPVVLNLEERKEIDLSNMILIPEGQFSKGVDKIIEQPIINTLEIAYPSQKVYVKEYYIDKYPVTNKEYDEFCRKIEENGHIWCHSDEDCNKSHRRSTFNNPKAKPDHPVTGIDWYDAYAFAAWKGKKLPTANQWEKAARGNNGYCYENSHELINDFNLAFEMKNPSHITWKKTVLQQIDLLRTISILDEKNNKSPYNISSMIGNTWEWTRTRYLDQKEQTPSFRGMDRSLIWDDWSGWTIVKGGSFTSIGELLHPAYYEKRLLIERNNDVGFRCVYEN